MWFREDQDRIINTVYLQNVFWYDQQNLAERIENTNIKFVELHTLIKYKNRSNSTCGISQSHKTV